MADAKTLRAEAQQLLVLAERADIPVVVAKLKELAQELEQRAEFLDDARGNGSDAS